MQLKDYYSILGLSPSASFDEIKKAYRRLAQQYHPDKKDNDPYAAAQFAEIKEAYEILSNPSRKDIYLQQRWYAQSTGQKTTQEIITPVSVLKKMIELDKHTSRIDIHRMDKAGLYNYVSNILSGETIKKLNEFNEPDINQSIVEAILRSCKHLDWPYAKKLASTLQQLNTNNQSTEIINKYLRQSQQAYLWNQYRPWIILLMVLIICLLIYVTNH